MAAPSSGSPYDLTNQLFAGERSPIAPCHSREGGCATIQKITCFLVVMPDLIPAKDGIFDRHPET
jgi:hypothetical protein